MDRGQVFARGPIVRVAARDANSQVAPDSERSHAVMSDDPAVLDIELLDQQGQSVSLRDLRGRPVVLVFLRWLG